MLTDEEKGIARQAALEDPYYFMEFVLGFTLEWFHRMWFDFCWKNPKHVLEAPRGFGKSTICTTGYVLWRIIRDPNIRVLIVARTETQALRFAKEIRDHMEMNPTLVELFGPFMGVATWTDRAMTVRGRTVFHKEPTITAMGLEGPITGGHWELIIPDDPFDEESSRSELMRDRAFEWLFTTLTPTLMPGGSIGVRCTRYHYGDLAGRIERDLALDKKTGEAHLYKAEEVRDGITSIPRDNKWKVLKTPAILRDGTALWEARSPLKDRITPDGVVDGLETLREEMTPLRFSRQYLMECETPDEGAQETVFRRVKRINFKHPEPMKLRRTMHIDPAWTSREEAAKRRIGDKEPDSFAVVVAGFDDQNRCFFLEAWEDMVSPTDGLARACAMAQKWKPSKISCERGNLQLKRAPRFYQSITGALMAASPGCRVTFTAPREDKMAHAEPLADAIEKGFVVFDPDYAEMMWDQLAPFPFARHDDIVDGAAGAYLLGERPQRPVGGFLNQQGGGIATISDIATAGATASLRGSGGVPSFGGPSVRGAPGFDAGGAGARSIPRG
jgi:phage terminase large subunit-like protein